MFESLAALNLAWGRYDEAIDNYRRELAIVREFKDRVGEGGTLNNLGIVYRGEGRYAEAIDAFERSLAIVREYKDRVGEGGTLSNLGIVYRCRGGTTRRSAPSSGRWPSSHTDLTTQPWDSHHHTSPSSR